MFKIIEKFIPKSIRTPVARPLGAPTIQYLQRLVDNKNTPESRQWRQYAGDADTDLNRIRIFINKDVPDITDIPESERLTPIDINTLTPWLREQYIPRVLRHEMRHIRNGAYRDYMDKSMTNRYYDLGVLSGLDEISAYTDESLYDSVRDSGQIRDIDILWDALDNSFGCITQSYLNKHSSRIEGAFFTYASETSDVAAIKHAQKLLAQNPVKYCRSTKIIADYFLTFDGIHLLDKKVKMPPEIKQTMKEFRDTYEDVVRSALQTCITEAKRYIYPSPEH